jgi:integrase
MAALRGQVQWEQKSLTTGLLEPLPGLSDVRFFPFVDGGATQALQRLAKKAGIPPLTLHDLRRTFATRAATGELTGQSMPLLHLTRIMGHSSPTITAKYYVYLQDAELIRQMRDQEPITMDGPTTRAISARESR